MALHGTPNDLLQNLDPIALIIFIPLLDRKYNRVYSNGSGLTSYQSWSTQRCVTSRLISDQS